MANTVLQNLQAAKTNISATLVTITASPKPSYSVDGKSIPWSEYHSMLVEQLGKINQLILAEGDLAVGDGTSGGPIEYRSQAIS